MTQKKCIDLLTSTRTHERRSITWEPHPADAGCPCCGELEITKSRKSTTYSVTEFPVATGFGLPGRAFRLVKAADAVSYELFLADDRRLSFCSCPGATFGAVERADRRHGDTRGRLCCCHADALDNIVGNGWLPDPRGNGEADR
jgi:hypothetical protein